MKLRLLTCLSFLAISLAAPSLFAQSAAPAKRVVKDTDPKDIKLGEDEPGCKDSILMPRLPGCSIIQCDSKESDTLTIQVGVSPEGVIQKELMDGSSEVIYYLCPAKTTLSQIVKSSDAALVKAGFKTVYNGKDDDEQPIVTSSKESQWVQVSTYTYNQYNAYVLSAINADEDDDDDDFSDALAEELTKSGRVTLAGLQFQADKAELPADAGKVMAEVAALLARQPDLKIRVEAHGVETSAAEQRASAVAAWLIDHGIDKARVSTLGVAQGEPKIELVRF